MAGESAACPSLNRFALWAIFRATSHTSCTEGVGRPGEGDDVEDDPVECGEGSGEIRAGGVGCDVELDREWAELSGATVEGPGAGEEDAAISIMRLICPNCTAEVRE